MFFRKNRRQATGNRQCQKMPDPMNRHGAMTEFRSGLISADIFSSDGLDGRLASQPESMQTIAFLTIACRLSPVACSIS